MDYEDSHDEALDALDAADLADIGMPNIGIARRFARFLMDDEYTESILFGDGIAQEFRAAERKLNKVANAIIQPLERLTGIK